jgi:hypothetical protein
MDPFKNVDFQTWGSAPDQPARESPALSAAAGRGAPSVSSASADLTPHEPEFDFEALTLALEQATATLDAPIAAAITETAAVPEAASSAASTLPLPSAEDDGDDAGLAELEAAPAVLRSEALP